MAKCLQFGKTAFGYKIAFYEQIKRVFRTYRKQKRAT